MCVSEKKISVEFHKGNPSYENVTIYVIVNKSFIVISPSLIRNSYYAWCLRFSKSFGYADSIDKRENPTWTHFLIDYFSSFHS